jgi:tetratricopeptide (TPR) repeat protein
MTDLAKRIRSQAAPKSGIAVLLLLLASAGLYGGFLWNPVVFDDISFFDGSVHDQYLSQFLPFAPRWLPYATLEWTRAALGLNLAWFRIGNLALHACSAVVLYAFLRTLFVAVLRNGVIAADPRPVLSVEWLAFFAALLFALHPTAIYAVAYLVQRTSLAATLFVLLMAFAFLEGVLRRSQLLLLASAVLYLFAATSKEHAIMAPGVMVVLLLLIEAPSKKTLALVTPAFLLYAVIGVYVFFQIRTGHIMGQAYEPAGADMLGRLHAIYPQFDPALAYPLSILTQASLFFKYLLLWVVPNPAWMSIDMREPFALTRGALPYLFGLLAFLIYPIVAFKLLLRRGATGLLGLAMLSPWIMFATEFAAVRIQEPFVLYRSYIWMPLIFACLPFFMQRLSRKSAGAILIACAVFYVPLSLDRLRSFSHGLLLWDDAAQLIDKDDVRPGVDRIFHNRGVMLAGVKLYDQAIRDYDRAIRINPDYAYYFNDRAASWLASGHPDRALGDFDQAIRMSTNYARPFYGRALAEEKLGDRNAAASDFTVACRMGARVACTRLGTSNPSQ